MTTCICNGFCSFFCSQNNVERLTLTGGATELDVTQDGKTLALAVRGELWTIPSDRGGDAKRLTFLHEGFVERGAVIAIVLGEMEAQEFSRLAKKHWFFGFGAYT